jgi:hypothetical protein
MPVSWSTTSKTLLALATILNCSLACAALPLGILDACRSVQDVIIQLESRAPTTRACRQPRGDLERQYASRLARRGMRPCLLPEPLTPLLKPFSCAQFAVGTSTSLVCFRAASLDDLKTYKTSYGERQAAAEQRYLNAAAACPVSAGDAARVPGTMLSRYVAEIAAFELGFGMRIRDAGDGEGFVVHGYAETDPDLRGDVPSALEFVSVSTGAKSLLEKEKVREEIRHAGAWTLRVEDDAPMVQAFEEALHKQHLDVRLLSVTFRLEKRRGERTADDKDILLRTSGRTILRYLSDEGFERMSSAGLKALTGRDKPDMLAAFSQNLPYGFRKKYNIDADFDILFHEHVPACGKTDTGAVGANVLRLPGRTGVGSDYGSITLMLFAFGDCARGQSVHKYMTGLLGGAGNALGTSLAGQ